jgi:hypothetical protein
LAQVAEHLKPKNSYRLAHGLNLLQHKRFMFWLLVAAVVVAVLREQVDVVVAVAVVLQ